MYINLSQYISKHQDYSISMKYTITIDWFDVFLFPYWCHGPQYGTLYHSIAVALSSQMEKQNQFRFYIICYPLDDLKNEPQNNSPPPLSPSVSTMGQINLAYKIEYYSVYADGKVDVLDTNVGAKYVLCRVQLTQMDSVNMSPR